MKPKKQKLKLMFLIIFIFTINISFPNIAKVKAASSLENFVTRFYVECLKRQPDSAGLTYWTNRLSSKVTTGADISDSFIFSNEFVGLNVSDDEFIRIMYRTFFDRDADLAGKTAWMDKLSKGVSRRYVLSAFVNSQEFGIICSNYGIVRGSIGLPYAPDRYPSLTMFTYRLYNLCLDRSPDRAGLDYWVSRLISGETTGADMALGFANSAEFTGKNLANNDFVNIMYKVFFNRLPDASGLNYWVGKLQEGYSRRFALSGFVSSQEFGNICTEYGINRGSISIGSADMPFSFAKTDRLTAYNDAKYYQFTLPSSGKVTVNFRHDLIDNGSWTIQLLDSNKNSLQSFSSGATNINVDGANLRLPAGSYFIKVSTTYYDYSSTNFNFTVKFVSENGLFEKEFNNSLTTANAINPGIEYTGNMQSSSDVDYYKFTLSSAGKVSLNFKHELVSSGKWGLKILDSGNNELLYNYFGETSTNLSTRNLRLPAGTYYIKIEDYDGYYNNVDYKFTLTYTPEDNTYEKEFNNLLTTANAINTGIQYTGNLQSSSDVDYYKFTLSSAGKVSLNFKHELVSSGKWGLKILDSGNNELLYNYFGETSIDLSTGNLRLPAGTYYVKVEVYSSSSYYNNSDYRFTVNYSSEGSSYEKEWNGTLTTANVMDIDTQYTGNMQSSGDVDYYKFTLTSPKSVYVNFRHELVNNGVWAIQILNSSASLLQSFNSNSSSTNINGAVINLSAGTYYIKVQVYSSSSSYYNNVDYTLAVSGS